MLACFLATKKSHSAANNSRLLETQHLKQKNYNIRFGIGDFLITIVTQVSMDPKAVNIPLKDVTTLVHSLTFGDAAKSPTGRS